MSTLQTADETANLTADTKTLYSDWTTHISTFLSAFQGANGSTFRLSFRAAHESTFCRSL